MNRFKHLCYVKEKTKTARDNGYIDYYDMVQSEYSKGKSLSEVGKMIGISPSHIWRTLVAMGIKRRSRGGKNNLNSGKINMLKYPSRDRLKEILKYNKTGEFVWKIRPCNRIVIGSVAGCNKTSNYTTIRIDGHLCVAHRLVWIYHKGYNTEYQIDHINRNKKDNRIENLREVTQTCNNRNTGNPKNNTSGVKGIYWNKSDNVWSTSVSIGNKNRHIGSWKEFNEAVLARLSVEQCLNWEGCDSSSPAYKYCIKHKLIKQF